MPKKYDAIGRTGSNIGAQRAQWPRRGACCNPSIRVKGVIFPQRTAETVPHPIKIPISLAAQVYFAVATFFTPLNNDRFSLAVSMNFFTAGLALAL